MPLPNCQQNNEFLTRLPSLAPNRMSPASQLLNRMEVDGTSTSCDGDNEMEAMVKAELEAIAHARRE
jgi:hypothetical protein